MLSTKPNSRMLPKQRVLLRGDRRIVGGLPSGELAVSPEEPETVENYPEQGPRKRFIEEIKDIEGNCCSDDVGKKEMVIWPRRG